jgi:hypothetical protein
MRLAIALIAGARACTEPPKKQADMTQAPSSQQPIEAVLARAVAAGADPASIEAAVGKPALINMIHPRDRMAIQGADIRPDPAFQPSLPPLASAENVVYWKVEDPPRDVIVAGVYWMKGAHGVVFRGLIGPP